jgi:hypothetical protein
MVLVLRNCEYEAHINGSECAAYADMHYSTSLSSHISVAHFLCYIFLIKYYTLAALYTYPGIYLSTLLDNEATQPH